jgi:hypothetical protein
LSQYQEGWFDIEAEPAQLQLGNFGSLTFSQNQPQAQTDFNLQEQYMNQTNGASWIPLSTGGLSDDQFIQAAVAAASSVASNIPYDPLDSGYGRNSNAFIAGVLDRLNIPRPTIPGLVFAPGYYGAPAPVQHKKTGTGVPAFGGESITTYTLPGRHPLGG